MKVRLKRAPPADRLGAGDETLADEVENRPVQHDWTAEIGVGPPASLQICGEQTTALPKEPAIGHRQIALGRQVVGDENVMAIEFDMPVADCVDFDRDDRRAVDEIADGDEHFAQEIDADRMAGRKVKVLRRPVGAEGVPSDPDRKNGAGIGMRAAIHLPMAEPLDWAQRARTRNDEIAGLERLDRNIAARRADERAFDEARDRCRCDSVVEEWGPYETWGE
jgi:hypothetical protein